MYQTIKSAFISTEAEDQRKLVLSLSMTSLLLVFPTLYFPFIKISKLSNYIESNLIQAIVSLFHVSIPIAMIVFFAVIIAPMIMIVCTLKFALSEEFTSPDGLYYKAYIFSRDWMMLEVFASAVLLGKIRLDQLVDAEIAFGVLLQFLLWALIFITDKSLWFEVKRKKINHSAQKTFAFALAALFLLFPANILPIITKTKIGITQSLNLWESVMTFFDGPTWPVGVIVFAASFIGPWLKVFSLFYLSITGHSTAHLKFKKTLHDILEFSGRWTMINIFIAAMLVAIVRLNTLASVDVEAGSLIFSALVILTIMSSASFQLKEPELNET